MTILPIHPAENASPEALVAFLRQCREAARSDGRERLVSISLAVGALDPLTVLEAIFEPGELHFYAERPTTQTAIAGAEAVLVHEASGPDRFTAVRTWVDDVLARTIAVGDVEAPFGGPHFFNAFTFLDEVEPGEAFPSARVFVPRWQVARAGNVTTAVANLLVAPDADLAVLAERVWRAHGRFRSGMGLESGIGFQPMGSKHGLEAHATSEAGKSGIGFQPMGLKHGLEAHATSEAGESGIGFQPMGSKHGLEAHATSEAGESGIGFQPMGLKHGLEAHANSEVGFTASTAPVVIRQGANLPHWTRDGAIYAVTFRLADSLPASVIETWRLERVRLEQTFKRPERPLSLVEQERLRKLHSDRIEAFLDSGAGECHLRTPQVAEMVAAALKHFEGERYVLHAWCIMPNHVHVVVQPLKGHALADILRSWKSYTANQANRMLGRTGAFWQAESYDHLIRDESDYAHAIDYVVRNPEKAGLSGWRWVGGAGGGKCGTGLESGSDHGLEAHATKAGKSGIGFQPMGSNHGLEAHATKAESNHGLEAHATFRTSEAGDFKAAVVGGLKAIADGAVKKIVLARAQDMRAAVPLHPLRLLSGLRERFPECYSFSVANGRGHSFIGASPERLVRVSKGVLETEALAGSARRGATPDEDAALGAALLTSEKDLREHRHVLDSIVRRLEPLGLTPRFADAPGLRRLANVQHLHTPMSVELPARIHLLDALSRLHPTPAVGGSPREAAVGRIRELEGFSRGLYAGAIGWLNARGGGEFLVGIRSALVEGETARVYAGAGIVEGSDPEREFVETELKFQAMREALLG